jgi:cbb3-type cytochrome oxidase subunit 1
MKRVSDRFMQLAVVFALCGMSLGAWMGANENFTLAPVHAHTNLLGWVSMFLYALFYRAVPKAASGLLPAVHFWVNLISVLVALPMLAALLLNQSTNKPVMGMTMHQIGPILGVSELAMLASMLLFAIIVFRATWKAPTAA